MQYITMKKYGSALEQGGDCDMSIVLSQTIASSRPDNVLHIGTLRNCSRFHVSTSEA